MAAGIPSRALGPLADARVDFGDTAVPFVIAIQTVAATATYNIFTSNCPSGLKVIDYYAIATGGAGAASDTAVVDDGTTAIGTTLDMNIADTTIARTLVLNDATQGIARGGSLRVVTASAAVCLVYITCVWTD